MATPFINVGYYDHRMEEIVRRKGQKEVRNLNDYISKNNTQNKMKKGYTVLKLADLAAELGLPSSKGYKTKDFLELVINEIEKKDLRFVQFLQLVDVLYVIIEKVERKETPVQHVVQPAEKFRAAEEIEAHYANHPDPVINQQIRESTNMNPVKERESVTEAPPELERVKSRSHLKQAMKKNPLPWEK